MELELYYSEGYKCWRLNLIDDKALKQDIVCYMDSQKELNRILYSIWEFKPELTQAEILDVCFVWAEMLGAELRII